MCHPGKACRALWHAHRDTVQMEKFPVGLPYSSGNSIYGDSASRPRRYVRFPVFVKPLSGPSVVTLSGPPETTATPEPVRDAQRAEAASKEPTSYLERVDRRGAGRAAPSQSLITPVMWTPWNQSRKC